MSEVILWGPRNGKSLKRLYPEIEADTDFNKLPADELLFAWEIGIPGSPVDHDLADNVRYRTAAANCIKDYEKKQKFSLKDIPDDVKKAIRRFENTSPEARLIAKQMQQRMLINYEKIVNQDVDEMDQEEKQKYVNSTIKIDEALPLLLKNLEEGFGITEKQKKETALGDKSIDKFHSNRQER